MRILIFFTFFLFSFCSFSQNVIELKNERTGKTRILKAGTKFLFKTAQDSFYVRGKIVQIKDTSLVIYCQDYNDELPLTDLRPDEITAIKKPTTLHSITRSISTLLLPVGGYFLINGVLVLSRDNEYQGQKTYDEGATKALTVTGGAFVVAGAIPFLIKQKQYNLRKDWKMSVKKL